MSITSGVGLIFYPGALVEPSAYAPIARSVAKAGFRAAIVYVPFRLAPLQMHRDELTSRTRGLINTDEDRKWIVGGHSRGGALAAAFAKRFANEIEGLLLVGTRTANNRELITFQTTPNPV